MLCIELIHTDIFLYHCMLKSISIWLSLSFSLFWYIYIYIYSFSSICMYAFRYIEVCMRMCLYAHNYTCTYTHSVYICHFLYMCVCICLWANVLPKIRLLHLVFISTNNIWIQRKTSTDIFTSPTTANTTLASLMFIH